MISNVQAQRFFMYFKGNTHSYVKNELPKDKPEKGTKIKTNITNNKGTVDQDLITSHLNGDFGVGICPVNTEGKCSFGVIDIDYYKAKIRKVLDFIREYQLPLIPFRSKSGGLHLYLMLSKSTSAKIVRELLLELVKTFALDKLYGEEKVEIFPKQEKISKEGFGSAITLPYFNADNTYTYLLDLDGNEVPFDTALNYIQKHITNTEAVEELIKGLPYNDAPPCLQKILLSSFVGEEDSGRNNFLFSYALYASKKYGDNFEEYVREMNSSFTAPLDEGTIEGLINSVKEKEYSYKCKDIPCKGFCDKLICHKREYGLGRDKGYFSDIEYGQLYRYLSSEPYYAWELRLQGSDNPFKQIIFKDEGELLDQKNFARNCVRYLNFAPKQVQPNQWYLTLNKYLAIVKEVKVSAESDTSALAMVKQMFIRYLSNKQARRDSPYQIRANLCVRQTTTDSEGNIHAKFFFTHTGFAEYLRNNKVQFDQSMLRETLKNFGAREDVLQYDSATGDQISFPCWSKEEDAEIDEAYRGELEIEANDREYARAISEATNKKIEDSADNSKEKPYSQKDKDEAQSMF